LGKGEMMSGVWHSTSLCGKANNNEDVLEEKLDFELQQIQWMI